MREWIDRERAEELTILDWAVSLCEVQETAGKHVSRGKSSGCYQLESTFHSETSERPLRVGGLRGQGSEEPQSPQETRQVLDQQSSTVEICCTKMSEQTCSRTGERTHECVSEFFSLAYACLGQAVIRRVESDVVKRLEAYPTEDVEMDLPGKAIPDDEFHEEPHLEVAKVL